MRIVAMLAICFLTTASGAEEAKKPCWVQGTSTKTGVSAIVLDMTEKEAIRFVQTQSPKYPYVKYEAYCDLKPIVVTK